MLLLGLFMHYSLFCQEKFRFSYLFHFYLGIIYVIFSICYNWIQLSQFPSGVTSHSLFFKLDKKPAGTLAYSFCRCVFRLMQQMWFQHLHLCYQEVPKGQLKAICVAGWPNIACRVLKVIQFFSLAVWTSSKAVFFMCFFKIIFHAVISLPMDLC